MTRRSQYSQFGMYCFSDRSELSDIRFEVRLVGEDPLHRHGLDVAAPETCSAIVIAG